MSSSSSTSRNNAKSIGITAIVISFLFFLTLFLSILSGLPETPVSISGNTKSIFKQVLPQGWGFYSKDPRDDLLSVINMDSQESAAAWPNNKLENVFGLDRSGRAQGTETGLIMASASEDNWKTCKKDPIECLKELPAEKQVNNILENPTICGDIGIINQKPVPWSWSKNKSKIKMPSKVLRVNVQCSKK
ncbi:TPA: SdpA family antimicrobial peptide system protein [Bacillus cereus]|uniref:SdpA family antimicrobial peptide system protein n=1 Tax=Bacillus cereus group TaxID=86661 RepID=UPI00065B6990|nr:MULTISPECIES: SdpA family antimicrobial peptide system protein [Bacillus cereus group]ANN35627.1 hypothetical protein A9498_30085 [Bacillus thuringiensis serovar coreanensis]MBT2200788.1 SdpA family antimicrobial peptide system protein [Bacillus thuringiensis]